MNHIPIHTPFPEKAMSWSTTILNSKLLAPPPEWFLKSDIHYFPIPTEFVITTPQAIAPKQGRFYKLDLYVRGENLIPYDELRLHADFHGTSHEKQVYLYEVWADWGSDGHVDYSLYCWTLNAGVYQREPHQLYNHITNL
jgi:hypothetical protein